jgi:hypothetical protein
MRLSVGRARVHERIRSCGNGAVPVGRRITRASLNARKWLLSRSHTPLCVLFSSSGHHELLGRPWGWAGAGGERRPRWRQCLRGNLPGLGKDDTTTMSLYPGGQSSSLRLRSPISSKFGEGG